MPARRFNPVLADLPTTIFETMSALAREHSAVNLGQGFPDSPGDIRIRQHAAQAVLNGYNQYPPMLGLPELRTAIAAHYAQHQGLVLEAPSEVMVTSGATEAIAASLLAVLEPGDEVVLFEPLYDAYLPLVLRAGGVPKFVSLTPPDWTLTREKLAAAFSARTKLVLFNNPLNPAAKVFARTELALLAEFCIAHDAIALCDEVWEHVVFDTPFTPLMALPGMRERCIKIGSAGKIFSLTGWKVGFVMAAPPLLRAVAKAHQFLTFTTPPNLQAAVAYGLGLEEAFFTAMRAEFQAARDYLASGLESAGFTVLPAQGTYFLNIDLAPLGVEDDTAFARRLVREYQVASIPVSAFYAQNPVTTLLRVCFAKKRETLDAALEKLSAVKTGI